MSNLIFDKVSESREPSLRGFLVINLLISLCINLYAALVELTFWQAALKKS